MKRSQPTLDELLAMQIQFLATTLRPRSVMQYRSLTRGFLAYLHASFPHILQPSQLRRDPHLLGWFRFLCQHDPPLRNTTRELYLLELRRLLHDLADQGHPLPSDLIRCEDFPLVTAICPDHFLSKRINACSNNFVIPIPWRPTPSASCGLRESVLVNASISPWSASGKSLNSRSASMCRWANCIRNVWCQSMIRLSTSWRASWSCGP